PRLKEVDEPAAAGPLRTSTHSLPTALDRHMGRRAVEAIVEDVGADGLAVADAAAHADPFGDAGRHIGLRLEDGKLVAREEARRARLDLRDRYARRRLRLLQTTPLDSARGTRNGHAKADITSPRGRHVEAEGRGAAARETAPAEADAPELARLPADEQTAVRHLEVARLVGQPVAGAANEQRVVEHASTVGAGELA